MTRTIAIVPVRGKHGGKTRLAPLFDETRRSALVERMAWHVVSTIQDAGVVDLIVIVSRDEGFSFGARRDAHGIAYVVQPERTPGLNAALDFGRSWALDHGADRLLVMSGDLPVLDTVDVQELTDRRAPVVIAPDRFGTGTNGLMIGNRGQTGGNGSAEFRFRFGVGSFDDHLAEASRIGAAVDTVTSPGTSVDLDTPEDWCRLPGRVQRRLLDSVRMDSEPERSLMRMSLTNQCAWAESTR